MFLDKNSNSWCIKRFQMLKNNKTFFKTLKSLMYPSVKVVCFKMSNVLKEKNLGWKTQDIYFSEIFNAVLHLTSINASTVVFLFKNMFYLVF